MRTWLLILLALLVGVSVGVGAAVIRVETSSMPALPAEAALGKVNFPGVSREGISRPQVVVDQEEYNFGSMDSNATGRHSFVFRNVGGRPLTLKTGDTSCKCTVSKLERETVPPGQSAKVTLEWTAKPSMREYRQLASIKTNDPQQPLVKLMIVGRITTALRVVPQEFVLTRVSPEEPAAGQGRIYGFLPQTLKILSHGLADPDTAEHFDVAIEPLSPSQLREEEGAKSGYLVRVTVKPGLPLGAFGQTIVMQTNYPSVPKVEIHVVGEVRTDITVVGRGWNAARNVLALGTISSRTGGKWTLRLVVRGPHRKEVDFKLIKVVPDLLKVDLGPSTEINSGAVIQTPLLIEIPKGCRPINYLGPDKKRLGEITLQTQHPRIPELRIPIQFAVEEDSAISD